MAGKKIMNGFHSISFLLSISINLYRHTRTRFKIGIPSWCNRDGYNTVVVLGALFSKKVDRGASCHCPGFFFVSQHAFLMAAYVFSSRICSKLVCGTVISMLLITNGKVGTNEQKRTRVTLLDAPLCFETIQGVGHVLCVARARVNDIYAFTK
ncbi:hypothetical protein BJV82DRAFT_617220 [Fennellomyces sp. T-0311]|nr:hypothetical protein BJV82DRAFT_617220 [Fennellomyces sp. T-0311]